MVSDEAWAWLAPQLPTSAGRRGGRWRDHRQVIEAIAWKYRTGSPWRELPEEFGPWQTAYERLTRWNADGTWERLLARAPIIDYLPGAWPPGVVCIARRTRIPVERIPTERARKRRTIPKDQLALALEGRLEYVFGYTFILTNIDVSTEEKLAEVEWWYRHRTDTEALNKDGKLRAALRHLPSGDHAVNSVWMWAALLACAISSWLQEITGIDRGNGRSRSRRTVSRLRRELINIPARVVRRAGVIWLRLPPGEQLLATVLPELQRLPRAG